MLHYCNTIIRGLSFDFFFPLIDEDHIEQQLSIFYKHGYCDIMLIALFLRWLLFLGIILTTVQIIGAGFVSSTLRYCYNVSFAAKTKK